MTNDPFEQEIRETLIERYGDPPALDPLWNRVSSLIAAERSLPAKRAFTRRWEQWGRLQRAAIIVISALTIMVLLAGTAFALNHTLFGVFKVDPGSGEAYIQNYGKTVHLVQTHEGYSMTIKWVYSDRIRTIIGYQVNGPKGHHFKEFDYDYHQISLQTDDGQELPFFDGASPSLWPGSALEIAYFDTSALVVKGNTLALHLNIPMLTAVDDVNNAPTYTSISVPGPFHFDYTTPYYSGQTIDLHQTRTYNGNSVTLDQVIVTPSAAQAYLTLGFPYDESNEILTGSPLGPHGAGAPTIYGGIEDFNRYTASTHTDRLTFVQISSLNPGPWSLHILIDQFANPNPTGKPSAEPPHILDVTFSFVVQ